MIYRPVHELTDIRWKDIGDLSQTITNFATDECPLCGNVDNLTTNVFCCYKTGQINALNARKYRLGVLINQKRLNKQIEE